VPDIDLNKVSEKVLEELLSRSEKEWEDVLGVGRGYVFLQGATRVNMYRQGSHLQPEVYFISNSAIG